MTAEKLRKRAIGQIILLVAGLLVLVAISATSIILVNQARDDSSLVVHTVEVQNRLATLLLDIRRAESSARAYLLIGTTPFLTEHEASVAAIRPGMVKLRNLSDDNPFQIANSAKLSDAIESRLSEFKTAIDFVKNNDQAGGVAMLRQAGGSEAVRLIREISDSMRGEEDRLLALRTKKADRTQEMASFVTIAGSALVILLAAISIVLIRQSASERDAAEARLRDNNLNLESTVDERTADLREANEEIQRFAYIVSHDLRSPLVNIMGFTSELQELRGDIFKRIATLSKVEASEPAVVSTSATADPDDLGLQGPDKQLSQEFSEALGFIKSSIGKMDRLISAILNLTREGRREFKPVEIDTRELIEGIASTVAHQASETDSTIRIEPLPIITSDRLALEQIFGNLIDNALKYLRTGVPGDISVRGKMKLGFAIFEIVDNGRGIDDKDHQRIFDLFRRAGTQDRQGQGIGLAHVRALVRRLGGTISVSSKLNEGSTFTITLPAKWTLSNRGKVE